MTSAGRQELAQPTGNQPEELRLRKAKSTGGHRRRDAGDQAPATLQQGLLARHGERGLKQALHLLKLLAPGNVTTCRGKASQSISDVMVMPQKCGQQQEETKMGRGILLWLIGVPIPIIILLALIWH